MSQFESGSFARAFNASGPYAFARNEEDCPEDPLGLDTDDFMPSYPLDTLSQDPLALTSNMSPALANVRPSSPWTAEHAGWSEMESTPVFLGGFDADTQQDASLNSTGLGHETWSPRQESHSFTSASYINSPWNSLPLNGWDIAGPEASQAYSADIAQSPEYFIQQHRQTFSPCTRSQAPSEHDLFQFNKTADGVGANAEPHAGIEMDWMEGFDDARLTRPASKDEVSSHMGGQIKAGNAGFPAPPDNACAFVGELFSAESDRGFSNVYQQNSQVPIQDLGPTSGGISIPYTNMSSEKHEMGVPASFPTTKRHYPRDLGSNLDIPGTAAERWHGRTESTPIGLSVRTATGRSGAVKGRPRRGTASTAKSEHLRLNPIAERGEWSINSADASPTADSEISQHLARPNRAKRGKPFTDDQKAKTARIRQHKLACLCCKARKTGCDGSEPCNTCMGGRDGRHCLKAVWSSYVEGASCDHAFHLMVAPPNSQAIFVMPPTIYPELLISFIVNFQDKHNLLITHVTGHSYTVDLRRCLPLLSKERRAFRLRELFAGDRPRAVAAQWLKVLVNAHSEPTHMHDFQLSGIMPSKATYTMVPRRDVGTNMELLDPTFLFPAATISRIILRALELATHEIIEQRCSKVVTLNNEKFAADTAVLRDVGKLACLIRLRAAFCEQYQYQVFNDVESLEVSQDSRERLKLVSKIIFFWYRELLRKRVKAGGNDFSNDVNCLIVDGRDIEDPFPDSDTLEGFEQWLAHGETVLNHTGFRSLLRNCQPTPHVNAYPYAGPSYSNGSQPPSFTNPSYESDPYAIPCA